MPRLMGVNLLGVLLAALVMFFVGFIFYGMLFTDIWMTARGYTPNMFEDQSGAWMGVGFLIEIVLALALGWLLKAKGVSSLGSAVGVGVCAAILFGFPLLSYEFAYGAHHSVPGLLVDWGHILVGFVAGAAVLSVFD